VREHEGRVEILVEDDGRGFEVQARRGGFGLVGMRERVELERGTLQVTSRPGDGTRVEVTLPLRRRQV
jgi:signal transduction histidine kinase